MAEAEWVDDKIVAQMEAISAEVHENYLTTL